MCCPAVHWHTLESWCVLARSYVKGSPEKGELGDCPFSHRTMLTLEEKGIPYNKLLIDELAMPEW